MSVSLNEFAVKIVGDDVSHFKRGAYHYYGIPHLGEYRIKLTNDRETRCDAEVSVDGESVGKWRINPHSSITVERPAKLNRRFVFVEEGGSTARGAGVVSGRRDNGLITVVFRPEKESRSWFMPSYINRTNKCLEMNSRNGMRAQEQCYSNVANESMGMGTGMGMGIMDNEMDCATATGVTNDFRSGATILGAGTDQHFTSATPLDEVDRENITTVNLRLVVKRESPFVSVVDAMRTPVSTLRPPRVDRLFDEEPIMFERPYL